MLSSYKIIYIRFPQNVLILADRVCSWPWQWFALRKTDHLSFVISNQCIPVKNISGWSAVVFCACEIIQLFSLVFCVVRAVHNFDFRLVINEEKLRRALIETHVFWKDLYVFAFPSSRMLRDCTQAVQVNCSLLSHCFPNVFLRYPKPLIRKSFLPNVGKTLTAQKTCLTSEERSVKNRKQTICLMQCLYFKHL
jgi:hypothetical protein